MRRRNENQPEQEENSGIDYSVYHMGILEWLLYVCMAGAVLFLVGYIFYRSIILSFAISLFGLLYPKMRKKKIIEARKNKLNMQFKDMLYSLSSAVGAGNSVESAISVVLDDMEQQYNDPNVFIIKELSLMKLRLQMNRTVEEVFNDFAARSHLEDIETFASIFQIAKRTGGNLIDIIRNTTQIIADKIEINQEIETMLSGQQAEQKVLTILPFGLVLFMTKSSGDFMEPIFTTAIGRGVATISLAVILLANLWSKKIASIRI
ncbi:MAG: type II secretion system F family protein [Lachnospiraceae bacterium]|nr:type II secretion system F family protein [Lachnospiraceae bacterium]